MNMPSTITPRPPTHCRIERHKRRPGGRWSRPEITVEPVVVMPDMDSKKASARLICSDDSTKGTAPATAKVSHNRLTCRKAKRVE